LRGAPFGAGAPPPPPPPRSSPQTHPPTASLTSHLQLQDKREGSAAASDADAALDGAAAAGGRAARSSKSAPQGSAAAAPRDQQHRCLPPPTTRDVAGGDAKPGKALPSGRATDKQVGFTAAAAAVHYGKTLSSLFAALVPQRRHASIPAPSALPSALTLSAGNCAPAARAPSGGICRARRWRRRQQQQVNADASQRV
jgi:hypothetical protein